MRLLVLGKVGLSALVMSGLMSACGGNDGKKTAPRQPRQVGGLAGELTRARDFNSAVQATHSVLAKGGLPVVEGNQIVIDAVGPSSTATFSLVESYAMAAEARNRASAGRMTLAELGDMLHDFGWPFKDGPLPGEQLVEFLKVWVTEARKDPGNPQSFTPLFLADMAQVQVPAVDLAAGEYSPEELRFSLLELHLLAAAFDRALAPQVRGAWLPRWLFPSPAHAQGDPCSQFKERINKAYKDLGKGGTEAGSVVVSELVGIGLQKAIDAVGLSGEAFGDALSALGIAAKLWKLVALYSNVESEVTIESDNPLHKPLRGERPKYTAFTVRAGVNDKDWGEFQKTWQSADVARAGYDCLAALGIPVPADKGDIGKEAASWRVEWLLLGNVSEHAQISIEGNQFAPEALGQLQMNLQKSGDHAATATLVVDILPEKYEHKGIEKKVEVIAKATLETSAPPSLGTIVNAIKGGRTPSAVAGVATAGVGAIIAITDALVEVCAGWFQEIAEPKAYATLTVTYHEPGVKLNIVDVSKFKLDFRGKKRLWLIGGMVSENSYHVYDGGIRMEKDSTWIGQVQATAKGAYTAMDTVEATKRAAELGRVNENSSFQEAMKAFGSWLDVVGNLPNCKGTYEGVQTFAVKGGLTSNEAGATQVELALIPVGPPESYRETPGCPWVEREIDGIKTLPLRIPKGEETALTIDFPKPGEERKYREYVKIPEVFGSTVITVGP